MKELDFLPADFRQAARRRQRRRQAVLLGAAVLLLLAVVHAARFVQTSIAAHNTVGVSTRPESPVALIIAKMRALQSDAIILRSLEITSASATADVNLNDDFDPSPSVEAVLRLSEAEPAVVRVTGYAATDADLSALVSHLVACPYVVNVRQAEPRDAQYRGRTMKTFRITLELCGSPRGNGGG